MRAVWADVTDLLRQTWRMLRARQWWVVIFLLVLLTAALILVPYDEPWLARLTDEPEPRLVSLAWALTEWGDYQTGSLLLGGVVLLVGLLRKSERVRRAALASLMAASLGGLTANIGRGLLGRPRPVAELPDGLYGPSFRFKFQGSPSAHAATAFGSAAALVVALPAVGIPAGAAALAVGWSRLYLRHHHPTDVGIGGSIGALFGVILGVAARSRTLAPPAARRGRSTAGAEQERSNKSKKGGG